MNIETEHPQESRERHRVSPVVIPESRHPIKHSHLDREALKVLYRLRDAGFKGYLVGGGVRDIYLGKSPKDFDISTDARPGQLRKLFRNSRTIGRRFRLVQVFFRGNKIIEVSTLRSQSEFDINDPDQVLPHNNTFGTLEEDAFRRDLTINALFYEIESNTVIDYTGGVEDLKNKIIRTVGDPDRRFTRDPVRMLRVVRHAARSGFSIEKNTLESIHTHYEKLSLCPPSRLRDEILKDLKSGSCQSWGELCMGTPIWKTLFPIYSFSAKGRESKIKKELIALLGVLDRLYQHSGDSENKINIPDPMLFAVLLLPWAVRNFKLFDGVLKGRAYHRLSRKIRSNIDLYIGQPYNMKRMVKDSIAILLINLPAYHHHIQKKNIPKWFRKKSYFEDCSRFYSIYQEAIGSGAVQPDAFYKKQREEQYINHKKTSQGNSGSPGRKGVNPSFSSKKTGVFGLNKKR